MSSGRNPRAHGTREGSPLLPEKDSAMVAIHVLMEHVKARLLVDLKT